MATLRVRIKFTLLIFTLSWVYASFNPRVSFLPRLLKLDGAFFAAARLISLGTQVHAQRAVRRAS